MMKRLIVLCFSLLVADFIFAQQAPLANEIIRVCDDGAEWPPYTYYKRDKGKRTNELVGFSVEVVKKVFHKHNIKFHLSIIPWGRCQSLVEKGTEYQMFLSGTTNPTRIKKYLISQPYYSTSSYYFWSKRYHPNGLNIKVATDLSRYQIGGVMGYGNSLLKKLKVDLSGMDSGAKDLKALVTKLHSGRVDVFLEEREIVVGLTSIGVYDFTNDPLLGRALVPEAEETNYHMMFTKLNPIGLTLMSLVNQELTSMKRSGELAKILKKYVN